jgi:hypothetical protein
MKPRCYKLLLLLLRLLLLQWRADGSNELGGLS